MRVRMSHKRRRGNSENVRWILFAFFFLFSCRFANDTRRPREFKFNFGSYKIHFRLPLNCRIFGEALNINILFKNLTENGKTLINREPPVEKRIFWKRDSTNGSPVSSIWLNLKTVFTCQQYSSYAFVFNFMSSKEGGASFISNLLKFTWNFWSKLFV